MLLNANTIELKSPSSFIQTSSEAVRIEASPDGTTGSSFGLNLTPKAVTIEASPDGTSGSAFELTPTAVTIEAVSSVTKSVSTFELTPSAVKLEAFSSSDRTSASNVELTQKEVNIGGDTVQVNGNLVLNYLNKGQLTIDVLDDESGLCFNYKTTSGNMKKATLDFDN